MRCWLAVFANQSCRFGKISWLQALTWLSDVLKYKQNKVRDKFVAKNSPERHMPQIQNGHHGRICNAQVFPDQMTGSKIRPLPRFWNYFQFGSMRRKFWGFVLLFSWISKNEINCKLNAKMIDLTVNRLM